eukprot:180320_1
MASNEIKKPDRQALLTTTSTKPLNTLQKHKKYMVLSLIIVVLLIFIILLFIVFDVFSTSSDSTSTAGMIGKWPTWGGGLKNQQTPPSNIHIAIDKQNIKNVFPHCIYNSSGGLAFTGFPTVDDDNNTYFSDTSGYITSISLNNCSLHWRQHVGTLLGFPTMQIQIFQTLTLFSDSYGNKGALFGAPSTRSSWSNSNYSDDFGCYAVAVHLNNGSLWWSLTIGKDYNKHDYKCTSHGFYVENNYAYGGFSASGIYDLSNDAQNIGRMLKIDIDKHEIV